MLYRSRQQLEARQVTPESRSEVQEWCGSEIPLGFYVFRTAAGFAAMAPEIFESVFEPGELEELREPGEAPAAYGPAGS